MTSWKRPITLMFSFIGFSKYSDKCFKLEGNRWNQFANLRKERSWATGIIFKDGFHIFGGYGNRGSLKSTEIVGTNGIVSDGPNMPIVISDLTITNFNQTSSILSGGKLQYDELYLNNSWESGLKTHIASKLIALRSRITIFWKTYYQLGHFIVLFLLLIWALWPAVLVRYHFWKILPYMPFMKPLKPSLIFYL